MLSDFKEEIATFGQYVPAGCQNIAGFLNLSIFVSDL
jgi:hypothetical protein